MQFVVAFTFCVVVVSSLRPPQHRQMLLFRDPRAFNTVSFSQTKVHHGHIVMSVNGDSSMDSTSPKASSPAPANDDESAAGLSSELFLYGDYFDDEDDDCFGTDSCYLPEDGSGMRKMLSDSPPAYGNDDDDFINRFLFWVPITAPALAYASYEFVARASDFLIHWVAGNNWVAVDGGAYEARIITPAINGVVIPAIAILFATLISNTFATMRQRQQDIRTTINMEAGELRVLQSMVEAFPNGLTKDRCRSYLIQYASRIIAESQPGVNYNSLDKIGVDSEMNGFLSQLNEMNHMHVPPTLLAESYSAVSRLNSERSQRISSLQSTFPSLHFTILSVLAISICVAFLMETNQEILMFMNAVQLRILWTMLIGTFSALGVVCYDLVDPFRGSYEISQTVAQLYTIRSALRASAKLARGKESQTLTR